MKVPNLVSVMLLALVVGVVRAQAPTPGGGAQIDAELASLLADVEALRAEVSSLEARIAVLETDPPTEPTPPPSTPGLWPVMATPPGGSLEAFDGWVDEQCGAPRSDWPVVDIGPGHAVVDTEGASIPDVAVVRVHHRPVPYPALKVKGKACIEVVGVPGPAGEMPNVQGVNGTRGFRDGDKVLPGGLIVRNLHVSDAGACIGVPNHRQFVAVEDSIIERCGGHAIITDDNAHHLYVRLLRNEWRDGGSAHLVYIDRAARADIIGNLCENPGSGHCIRSIAHVTHAEENVASNVGLDGVVQQPRWNNPDKPDSRSLGMHPFDFYNCGDAVIRNNTAIKMQRNQAAGVILYRGRTAFGYCDVKGKTADGLFWERMDAGSAEFLDPATWDEIEADIETNGSSSRFAFNTRHENNVTYTLENRNNVTSHIVGNSLRPSIGAGGERQALKDATKAFALENPRNPGVPPSDHCAALAAFAPSPEMRWLFEHVWPAQMSTVCEKGDIPQYIPRPVPANWVERQFLTLGSGNRALEGDTLETAVEVTPELKLDDKRRVFDGPREGHYFTFVIDEGSGVRVELNPGGSSSPPDPPEDPPDEELPTTRPLESASWSRLPDSAQDTVFVAGVDDAFPPGFHQSWRAIQHAWGGGVCVDDELFIWGGGHADGMHNGVLAMDTTTGTWRRVTEPSVWWTPEQCPDGVCNSAAGQCSISDNSALPFCRLFPDGSPLPGHTYYTLEHDGEAIWATGGNVMQAKAKEFPNTFRFDLASSSWSFTGGTNPIAKGHGGMTHANGRMFYHSSGGYAVLDASTGAWQASPGRGAAATGGQVATLWDPRHGRILFVGRGRAFWMMPDTYGSEEGSIPHHPIVESQYLGATYYEPEQLALFWDGGRNVVTLDTDTLTWDTLTPGGDDPGAVSTSGGAMSRFSYCGGRVVLVNGHNRDAYVLE